MRSSDQTDQLDAALAKAQGQMTAASKDRTNPAFKQAYATLASALDAVREPLAAHGLSLTQWPRVEDGRVVVATRLAHVSGQWLAGELALRPVKDDPQGIGSAITYARRYALMAACGIAPDDDDGEAATRPAPRLAARKREEPAAKADRQAGHHPSWPDSRAKFCAALTSEGLDYDQLAAWLEAHGQARPSHMAIEDRRALYVAIRRGGPKRAEIDEWLAERAAIQSEGT